MAGISDGSIRTRGGHRYKPASVRNYERALRLRVLPRIGHLRLADVGRAHLQALIDEEAAAGAKTATFINCVNVVGAIYRRAIRREQVAVNPAADLDIPRDRERPNRASSAAQVAELLVPLRPEDRTLYAAAAYSGLRRGELRALRVCDVDLKVGEIQVTRNWDDREGPISTKTESSERNVPLLAVLREHLTDHLIRTQRSGEDLLFARRDGNAFDPSTVNRRVATAWRRAGLEPVTLHDLRHTFASLLIDAGINLKAVSEYMGHSSITITVDRYGHLLPGSRDEVRAAMDDYLGHAGAVRRPTDDPRHEPVLDAN